MIDQDQARKFWANWVRREIGGNDMVQEAAASAVQGRNVLHRPVVIQVRPKAKALSTLAAARADLASHSQRGPPTPLSVDQPDGDPRIPSDVVRYDSRSETESGSWPTAQRREPVTDRALERTR